MADNTESLASLVSAKGSVTREIADSRFKTAKAAGGSFSSSSGSKSDKNGFGGFLNTFLGKDKPGGGATSAASAGKSRSPLKNGTAGKTATLADHLNKMEKNGKSSGKADGGSAGSAGNAENATRTMAEEDRRALRNSMEKTVADEGESEAGAEAYPPEVVAAAEEAAMLIWNLLYGPLDGAGADAAAFSGLEGVAEGGSPAQGGDALRQVSELLNTMGILSGARPAGQTNASLEGMGAEGGVDLAAVQAAIETANASAEMNSAAVLSELDDLLDGMPRQALEEALARTAEAMGLPDADDAFNRIAAALEARVVAVGGGEAGLLSFLGGAGAHSAAPPAEAGTGLNAAAPEAGNAPIPEAAALDTPVPETPGPEMMLPETPVPETEIPGTAGAARRVPETTDPEVVVQDDVVVQDAVVQEESVPDAVAPEGMEQTVDRAERPATPAKTPAPESAVPEQDIPEQRGVETDAAKETRLPADKAAPAPAAPATASVKTENASVPETPALEAAEEGLEDTPLPKAERAAPETQERRAAGAEKTANTEITPETRNRQENAPAPKAAEQMPEQAAARVVEQAAAETPLPVAESAPEEATAALKTPEAAAVLNAPKAEESAKTATTPETPEPVDAAATEQPAKPEEPPRPAGSGETGEAETGDAPPAPEAENRGEDAAGVMPEDVTRRAAAKTPEQTVEKTVEKTAEKAAEKAADAPRKETAGTTTPAPETDQTRAPEAREPAETAGKGGAPRDGKTELVDLFRKFVEENDAASPINASESPSATEGKKLLGAFAGWLQQNGKMSEFKEITANPAGFIQSLSASSASGQTAAGASGEKILQAKSNLEIFLHDSISVGAKPEAETSANADAKPESPAPKAAEASLIQGKASAPAEQGLPGPAASAAQPVQQTPLAAQHGTANPSAMSTMLDQIENIERLAEAMKMANRNGVKNLTMALSPAELGKVMIRVESKDGVISAYLRVERPEAAAQLGSALDQLRQTLRQQGIELGDLSLQQRGANESLGDFSGQRHGGGREAGESRENRRRGGRGIGSAIEDETDAERIRPASGRAGSGALNLFA